MWCNRAVPQVTETVDMAICSLSMPKQYNVLEAFGVADSLNLQQGECTVARELRFR
jgi:hypothetical protein